MLFLRHSPGPSAASGAPPSPAADAQSVGSGSHTGSVSTQGTARALKSFATGVSVLGLAYCLVQVAGVQYLATLTSVSLLAFLLVYLVWCATSRRRHQLHGGADGLECGGLSGAGFSEFPTVSATSAACGSRGPPPHMAPGGPLPSCSSAVELHDAELLRSLAAAGVFVGEWKPPRAVTPPPSYEEAVRSMPPPPPQNPTVPPQHSSCNNSTSTSQQQP